MRRPDSRPILARLDQGGSIPGCAPQHRRRPAGPPHSAGRVGRGADGPPPPPIPAPVTTAAVVAGPLAIAVLRPRTQARDIALFALQMWAFALPTSSPTTIPTRSAAGSRSATRSADRVLGRGELPNARLQRALSRPGRSGRSIGSSRSPIGPGSSSPTCRCSIVLARDRTGSRGRRASWPRPSTSVAPSTSRPRRRRRGGRPRRATPTRVERGPERAARRRPPVRRTMLDVGEEVWGPPGRALYDTVEGNPWAAMPSLHFAASLMAALLLGESGPLPEPWAGRTRRAGLRARLPRGALPHGHHRGGGARRRRCAAASRWRSRVPRGNGSLQRARADRQLVAPSAIAGPPCHE